MDYSDESPQQAAAEALAEEGRWQDAVALYRGIIARKPRDLLYRQRLAELLAGGGEKQEAVLVLGDIVDRLARDGMLLRAITVGKLILQLDPAHEETHRKVAALYARRHGTPPPPAFLPPLPPPLPAPSATTSEVSSVEEMLEVSREVVADARSEEALGEIPESPLFADLDQAEFLDVVKTLAVRRAEKGAAILVEGEPGTSMFIIVRGEVSVERQGWTLQTMGPGAFFGEMALLTHAPRMATVRATGDVILLELDEPGLRALVGKHPGMLGVLEGFHRRRLVNNVTNLSPLFEAMQPGERRALVEKFAPLVVAPGQTLLTQGQPGDGLYLILRGRFDVTADEDGTPRALPAMREGELFGEVSLIYETPCTATVRAAGPAVVLRLGREEFRTAIPHDSPTAAAIRKLGTERLKRFGMDAVLA